MVSLWNITDKTFDGAAGDVVEVREEEGSRGIRSGAMQLMSMTAGQGALFQEQSISEGGNGNIHGAVLNPEGIGFPAWA